VRLQCLSGLSAVRHTNSHGESGLLATPKLEHNLVGQYGACLLAQNNRRTETMSVACKSPYTKLASGVRMLSSMTLKPCLLYNEPYLLPNQPMHFITSLK